VNLLPQYRPRTYRFLGIWEEDAWSLKVYGIHHIFATLDRPLIDPEVLDAARQQVRRLLPEAEREGDHYGLGFVILHQGKVANWLLMQWWAHEVICCQMLSRSLPKAPTIFDRVTTPVMACVWELVVIDFERSAWAANALGGDFSRDRYLETTLVNGLY